MKNSSRPKRLEGGCGEGIEDRVAIIKSRDDQGLHYSADTIFVHSTSVSANHYFHQFQLLRTLFPFINPTYIANHKTSSSPASSIRHPQGLPLKIKISSLKSLLP